MLARGRASGMYFFDGSPLETLRSFWAAAICFPLHILLGLVTGGAADPGMWLIQSVGFVAGWAGFAIASETLAGMAGRGRAWPRFMAAWNWVSIPQHLVFIALAAPGPILPDEVGVILRLIAVGYGLWLEWFVAREALGLPGPSAAMFVVLDVSIVLFTQGIVGRLAM